MREVEDDDQGRWQGANLAFEHIEERDRDQRLAETPAKHSAAQRKTTTHHKR